MLYTEHTDTVNYHMNCIIRSNLAVSTLHVYVLVDPMKNLKEQNLRLEEEVRLLKAEQQSIVRRIVAIEEAIRKKTVQVDKGVSTVPEESSDDHSYLYSPIYSPAKSMPPLYQTPAHVGHFPPTYFPPSIASTSHISPTYMSEPVPHFPPPPPYHTSHVANCNPVKSKRNTNTLPSAAIMKEGLILLNEALRNTITY